MRRAVFLDRDGVICRNRDDYVKSWEEFMFLPWVLQAMRCLAKLPLSVVVITNQSAINRGLTSQSAVDEIHARMMEAVQAEGGRIDTVLYCPHRPDENCACRKPQPGLLLRAVEELNVDLSRSYLIGDAASDLQAGYSAGCQQLYLVLTGRGQRQLARCSLVRGRDFSVVQDLWAAVEDIVNREASVSKSALSMRAETGLVHFSVRELAHGNC